MKTVAIGSITLAVIGGALLSGCISLAAARDSSALASSTAYRISEGPDHRWLHGAPDCAASSDPSWDIRRVADNTFILRQNKCLTFEAPFVYVLAGKDRVLVLDTGAVAPEGQASLYEILIAVLGPERAGQEWVVLHSHGHRDHYRGDVSFANRANVILVPPTETGVREYLDLRRWPLGIAELELGNRKLLVMPSPGHQAAAISIYDPETRWLLTGDTLYPGLIIVKDWRAYHDSIRRLVAFSDAHGVSAVMGAHIEMKTFDSGYYPIGTTYQPQEAMLPLTVKQLQALDAQLARVDQPTQLVADGFVVQPMGWLQRLLSAVVGWFV